MFRPTLHRTVAAVGLLGLLVAVADPLAAQSPAKKVLTHTDYEIWNSATGVTLSRDGKYVAYTLFPPQGDANVIVRHLPSGKETTIARGGRGGGAGGAGDAEGGPAALPNFAGRLTGGSPQFTPDVKTVLIPLTPTKAELDKAKADKAETPQPSIGFLDLATGQVKTRMTQVRSYSIIGDGAGLMVYQKGGRGEATAKTEEPAGGGGKGGKGGGFGGKGGGKGGGGPAVPTSRYGSDVYIRDLATGSERTISDVVDYSISRDHKLMLYTVGSRTEDKNGVYMLPIAAGSQPVIIKAGPGRYTRMTWDEKQTKLAFFYDSSVAKDTTAPMPRASGTSSGSTTTTTTAQTPPSPPKWCVFVWDRSTKTIASGAKLPVAAPMGGLTSVVAVGVAANTLATSPATEVLGPDAPGLKKGWILSGNVLNFSQDGKRIYLAAGPERAVMAPPPSTQTPEAKAPATQPAPKTGPGGFGGFGRRTEGGATDDVQLDLWHWKDNQIQPMQKARPNADANRTYSAVLFLDTKQLRQVSDETIQVAQAMSGDWAVGSDDKPYQHLTGYGPTNIRDYSLVNVRNGEKKELAKAFIGQLNLSPNGKYVLGFDSKDWFTISVPDGKKTNLTAKLSVKFFNEDFDSPMEAPAYGNFGWTPDGKHVLVADKYDVWKIAADGSSAENVTKTGRKLQTRFRILRVSAGDDSPAPTDDRGIDLSKALLLAAENLHTRDTGFYRMEPGAEPKMLVMGARRYGPPSKARNADVYLLTVSTFYDYPDYYTTGPDFHELKRVTDINPKVREFNWGKAEIVHYRSADGLPLSGVLIKPENFDPSKKYPMMVYIYERLTQNAHNFVLPNAGTSINATFYASNGYLVYMPDIAYKVGSPGQSALKCVLPAISAVAEKGYLNEEAIGIQGHSWGGYQIAYMVTQTGRFKAAVAGAPVSNMVSAYGGIRWGTGLPRQFQYERTQSRIGATLWEAPMRFIENSPIFMADRVNTPLMMLHNDQDDAVPWYQGIEYYLALRRLGKEVYMLNYNGERHGLSKPSTRRDYTARMFQFFEHHLNGKPAPEWMAKGVPFADREKEKEPIKKLFVPEKK